MRKLTLVLFIIITLGASCSKNNHIEPKGKLTKENCEIIRFSKVSVSDGINLEVKNGDHHVSIETHENLHEYIDAYVQDECLYIEVKPGIHPGSNWKVKAYVSEEVIRSIHTSGGSKANIVGTLSTEEFWFDGSGGSKIEGNINCDKLILAVGGGGKAELTVLCESLTVESSGGSVLDLQGDANAFDLMISGGGKVHAFNFPIHTLNARLSGGAVADVTVNDRITGNLSGGSTIYCEGDPIIDVKTSGGSRVISDSSRKN